MSTIATAFFSVLGLLGLAVLILISVIVYKKYIKRTDPTSPTPSSTSPAESTRSPIVHSARPSDPRVITDGLIYENSPRLGRANSYIEEHNTNYIYLYDDPSYEYLSLDDYSNTNYNVYHNTVEYYNCINNQSNNHTRNGVFI